MKPCPAPICPRCDSNEDVKKIAYGRLPSDDPFEAALEGYVLGGCCIRPDSPEWYCDACEETFGTCRESWGEPLTSSIQ
jgi:hypothetical protein